MNMFAVAFNGHAGKIVMCAAEAALLGASASLHAIVKTHVAQAVKRFQRASRLESLERRT